MRRHRSTSIANFSSAQQARSRWGTTQQNIRRNEYSPKGAEGDLAAWPEGPGDGQAASVSAAKTPTAEPVSEVFWPFGTKGRAWRLLFFAKRIGSASCKRSRRDRQSGSARKGRRRHAWPLRGGAGPKKEPERASFGPGLPRRGHFSRLKPRARCLRLENTCSPQ